MEDHSKVTNRRGDGYQRDVPIQGQYKSLTLRGRADALAAQPLRLDEIKSYRVELARIPEAIGICIRNN